MDIDSLLNKIQTIENKLKNDNLDIICDNIINNDTIEDYNKIDSINHKFSKLSQYEKLYQQKNNEYKKLISNYSQAYLDICDFYVGPELPRETYLDSKKDIKELFTLFILGAIFEPYINAYHKKYIQNG
tara:strand:- start:2777 stop:3163 length:387 start_codon:yes stop_codon:yes gene_type:complete